MAHRHCLRAEAWVVGRWIASAYAVSAVALCSDGAAAQEWWDETRNGIPVPSIATSLPQDGDPSGVRKWLAGRGIVFGLEYTADVLSNVRGGLRTGTIYQGKLQGIVTADFDRLSGWQGLTGSVNVFQIHNTGRIRRDYVGGLNTIAAIEALPTTRLSEAWLEQSFSGGLFSIRAGQLAADSEFFYSELSTMFLQSDWPTIAAANLPSGGAAYPFATPGIRLRLAPTRDIALLLAVLNGDPAGPGFGDPELRNRYGLNVRVGDPPFVIGEMQVQRNTGKEADGLATVLKLGGWVHTGRFDDIRFAADGLPLADPASTGVPLRHRGNAGLYGVVDQQLYRPPGGDARSGVSIYTRMSVSPSDRNLIQAEIDGGIVFAGLWPARPFDRFGASVSHVRFSSGVRGLERDLIAYQGIAVPIRDRETNLELNYMAQVVPGWTLQTLVTFVRHAAGNPDRNATVIGARSLVRY